MSKRAGYCSRYYCISNVYYFKGSDAASTRPNMETFVHEFAHAIRKAMGFFEKQDALTIRDYRRGLYWSKFDSDLERIYQVAHAQGIWKGLYKASGKVSMRIQIRRNTGRRVFSFGSTTSDPAGRLRRMRRFSSGIRCSVRCWMRGFRVFRFGRIIR